MDNNKERKHYIDTVATLLIFAVFALCIIGAILLGAKSYKSITARDTASYEMRTCTQFISTKIRKAESPGMISVVDFNGGSALKIDETADGSMYSTYIYCSDNWLREVFTDYDDVPSPSAGEKLLELSSLDFSMENGLVTAKIISSEGNTSTLLISVRGGEALS